MGSAILSFKNNLTRTTNQFFFFFFTNYLLCAKRYPGYSSRNKCKRFLYEEGKIPYWKSKVALI